jgi:hypothetical protein
MKFVALVKGNCPWLGYQLISVPSLFISMISLGTALYRTGFEASLLRLHMLHILMHSETNVDTKWMILIKMFSFLYAYCTVPVFHLIFLVHTVYCFCTVAYSRKVFFAGLFAM